MSLHDKCVATRRTNILKIVEKVFCCIRIYYGMTIIMARGFRHVRLTSLMWLICMSTFLLPLITYSQDLAISDSLHPAKKMDWNERDLGFSTIRIGIAAIYEQASYSQNERSKEQLDLMGNELKTQWEWRDIRFFANGRLNMKRKVIWKIAAMYDGNLKDWTFRETGFLIGLPELKGNVFVGRSKEGYSLNKVQNGYSCWGNERQMSLDLIPIMTDGIRFYGYLPESRILWSVGAFSNLFYGHNNKFALWEWQYSGRIGWRPVYDEERRKLVHIGINFRYTEPDLKKITVKSRPESNPAPYFINTGQFESDKSTSLGWEVYYRSGPLMVCTEGNLHAFRSAQASNPKFLGAAVEVTYLITGEAIPYLSDNSAFFFVEPKRSLFKGGAGAWQVCLRYSMFDTNDGLSPGGSFWKITPWVNWYVSPYLRIEFVYGYGVLDRFGLEGTTQFFQTRFQLQVM